MRKGASAAACRRFASVRFAQVRRAPAGPSQPFRVLPVTTLPRPRIPRRTLLLLWGLLPPLLIAGCSPTPASPPLPDDVSVTLADDLALTLWATEPMVVSPVALSVDHRGVVYVTETRRRKTSNLDIRRHRDWITDDLSFESIADKRAFLHDRLAPARSADNAVWLDDRNGDGLHDWRDLTVFSDRIHRVLDTDGDGVADSATVFADGFNTEVTGVGAGVLAADDAVYYTIAPDLWRLRDTDGDGVADQRTALVNEFGVHFGYAGHDMSGLTMGPDGRVYWTIGDIGVDVTDAAGRRWHYPYDGAVLRANPDGSGFEVFARGLRNPQEIAFDAFGNLFTADNDSDKPGDDERIVYVTEGSDSGWRMYWQFGKYTDPRSNDYNVWLAERYHAPAFEGQAAFLTPPVAYHHAGPAGFAYNPGTALSDRWDGYFFVSQFTGTPSQSRITAFRVEPQGASFRLVDDVEVVRGLQATGLAFGPDGALYFADWLEGWEVKDRGRIWRLDTPATARDAARRETQRLLAEGAAGRSTEDLHALLGHADQRVRMMAQFELVRRHAAEPLIDAAHHATDRLARIHGIWGIGQMGRADAAAMAPIVDLLGDPDSEIRAQVARVMGDARYRPALAPLIALLQDDSARVRFFAAEALGKLADPAAIDPLLALLEANADADPHLRHAGALALARIDDTDALVDLATHPARSVRVAAVVALRRLRHPGVAAFLQDADEGVVTEAARAIHDDTSIPDALPALARIIERHGLTSEALLRRALNANLRLGRAEDARRVAAYADRADAPEAMRVEAVQILGVWPNPLALDRVEGRYRDLGTRDPAPVRAAVQPRLAAWLADGPEPLRIAAAHTAGALRLRGAAGHLYRMATTPTEPPAVRTAALDALDRLGDTRRFIAALEAALADAAPAVRTAALTRVLDSDLPADRVTDLLATVLDQGGPREQQTALAALGRLDTDGARRLLQTWMERLLAGTVPPEVQLDLLEAAEAQGTETLQAYLARYDAAKPADDPLASYLETLYGGDPEAGRAVVYEHESAQCMRCHQIGGEGGGVAPDLTTIGDRADRRALLESLIRPSAVIAPGYGEVTLTLRNGDRLQGRLLAGTDTEITVQTSDGSARTIALDRIAERSNAPSAMPPMDLLLSRREIRDVIAYLATLRQVPATTEASTDAP